MPGTVVLVCGGYRSGSTLTYNLLGEYVERSNLGRRIGFVEPEQAELLPAVWSFVEALGTAVAKCHLAPGTDERSRAWSVLRAQGRLLPIYTVRDWRDVVHSWSRKFDQPLEHIFSSPRWRLNLANLESWLGQGAREVRYEQVLRDPACTLRELAQEAGLPLDETAVQSAVAASRPGGATAGATSVDPRTLLHPDHVADPGGGAWRTWTAEQRAIVAPHVDPLLRRFGYPPTPQAPPA